MPIDDLSGASGDMPAVLRRLFANLGGSGGSDAAQPAPPAAPQPAAADPFYAGASASPNVPVPPPSSTPNPQMGTPDSIAATLPWMPQYRTAQAAARPALTTATGQMVPGLSKAQKLQVLLSGGLKGALAGRAASEQAVIQSGGRRSAGVGTGFEAGYFAPSQETANAQNIERGALTNQQQAQQVAAFPQMQALNIGKSIADILKSRAEAGKDTAEGDKATAETGAIPTKMTLEQAQAKAADAQAEAANYKEDPNLGLIDLRTKQPVNASASAPLTAEEATVLGKQPGERVPVKLKNTASEIAARGLTTVNTEEGVFERNRIAGTNTRLGNNPREISLDTPVGALDNTSGKQVMVTKKDIIANPGRYAPVSADVSTPVTKQVLKDYASTKPNTAGGNKIAFNTAMAHLGLLNDAIDALGNGNMKIFNSARQTYKEQTGSTVGATFDTVKQAVSGELAKVTGSLSQGEQEAIKGPLGKSNSPQSLKAAVVSAVQIMDGKMDALHQHYVDQIHEEPDEPLMSPAAKKVRDKLLGGQNGNANGGAQRGGQIQVKDPTGGVHTFPDQASADKFRQLAGIH